MRLLSENLVMFRDSNGAIGCVVESCPHRGASLFFGRNEESGLRCVYHGWKFDVSGACVDMPSEPVESNFKNKVRVRAYPARDVNHMVWVYMGPRAVPPPFPTFEINTIPPENVGEPMIMMEEANWVQNLEGDLDSNHLDYLHARLDNMRYRLFDDAPKPTSGNNNGVVWRDKSPRLDIHRTEYGAVYSARRDWPEDPSYEWHRINQFIFPFHTMITGGDRVVLRSFVPLDDEWSMLISHWGSLTKTISDEERRSPQYTDPFARAGGYIERTSDPRTYFNTRANRSNDFARDYDMEATTLVCGVPLVGNLQDRAMTELMTSATGEHIYDRSREHLGTLDSMVITVRRMLIRAAKTLRDEGTLPANIDNVALDRIRHATVVLPRGADWFADTATIREADSGLGIAHEMRPLAETALIAT
jgi:nitrite reductase/ring-hydroxylating ferredoxin subunit